MTDLDRDSIRDQLRAAEQLLKNSKDLAAWNFLMGIDTECPTVYDPYMQEENPCIRCAFYNPDAPLSICLTGPSPTIEHSEAVIMDMMIRFIADCKAALGES